MLGLVYAGVYINDKFLDVYQFVMWFFIAISFMALFLPSEDLFKDGENSKFNTVLNWCFALDIVLVSIWFGMPILACYYLVVNILLSAKKQTYFKKLES